MPQPRPTIRHFPKKPPKPPVETDLKTLGDAANEAAKREAAQWFFFLTIMITLAALVGSTTHRVLFLEDPVRVPILGVELPLLGFYVAAPAIFVVLHFYLLAQLQLMAGKVNAFLDAVEGETAKASEHRERALRRLDSFSVAQLMAADRFGARSLPLRLMVSVTLVLAPILLLLFFQIRFLPHHTESITLWHQVLVAADLVLLWWLWPFPRTKGARLRRTVPAITGSLGVLGFSWFLAVIPGDDIESGWLSEIRTPLFDGITDEVTQRPTSPFPRRLVLLDQVFLTEAERKAWAETPEDRRDQIGRTRVLRGRDLRFAELDRADLRRADLTGASLQGAILAEAQLQGALLVGAQMQRAVLDRAQMQRALLDRAQMQGAVLVGAQMQGAVLVGAQMQGAVLVEAQMQGAVLAQAQMQGAILVRAQMQGAVLAQAQMQGAFLGDAQLQGANLRAAQMQGAVLSGAHAWRLQARDSMTSEALLDALAFGAEPPCEERAQPNGSCRRASSWRQAVEAWLAKIPPGNIIRDEAPWHLPVGIPFHEIRDAVEQSLAVLLEPEDPPVAERATTSWTLTISPDPGRVAERLGGLACDAEHAPHIARGVFYQIQFRPPDGRDLGPHRAILAARMLRGDCTGTQGLPPNLRAQLARIAASLD